MKKKVFLLIAVVVLVVVLVVIAVVALVIRPEQGGPFSLKGGPFSLKWTGNGPQPGKDWTATEAGMEFVWIAALKLHVGKYEVTNGEYRKKDAAHESRNDQGHDLNDDRQPVVYVSFDEAKAYAAWLTARERAARRLPEGWQYRLPTETEWLAFAKCGDNREYPWGNALPPKHGNYDDETAFDAFQVDDYRDGSVVTCPVEKSGKNDWNLYGVGGNVWECVANQSGGFSAWRGAAWSISYPDYMRCTYCVDDIGSTLDCSYGFRLVLAH